MKFFCLVFTAMAVIGTYAVEIDLPPETVIVSPSQIEEIARSAQEQFWILVPPAGGDSLYIHADQKVYPVDWKAFKNKALTSQLAAEMESVNSSLYPVYRLTLVETREGELFWYNGDRLVWRTAAPLDHNPYLFAFDHFGVDSIEVLDPQNLLWGRSSNVGAEILLLPETFMASYEQDVALESQSMALTEPTAMMSMPQTVTNLTLGVENTGGVLEVGVFFPTGYTNLVRVYACSSLTDQDWSASTNINPSGISECIWTNGASRETRYWIAAERADHDLDGLENGDEKFIHKTDPGNADSDGDGINDGAEIANGTNPLYADSDGDGMGDGAEAALATSVAANGSGGVLVVVPETGWYHATDPNLNLVYLGE